MGASKSKSSVEEDITDKDNNNSVENELKECLQVVPTSTRITASDMLELPPDCMSLANLQINETDTCMSISGLIKNSLENGRNLNSAVIVAFGESGAGKSSTINKLFNDKNLCKTVQVKSVTTAISIVKKKLVVPHNPSSVAAYLCLVDTPGTFDSDGNDEKYTRLLKQFRTCDPLLNSKQRKFYAGYRKLDDGSNVRITVYPNVVLFFVNADTKIDGEATRIHQSLQVLKETNLVDTKYPNLIIVITRALQFIDENEDEEMENISFRKNYPNFRKAVWKAVEKIFGIKECPVTVVENKPFKQLQKRSGSDYFELPNGELSHHNVLMAIKKCFETRATFSDNLGKLLVGWYLDPECPERNQKAKVMEYNFTENPEDDETSTMSEIEVKTYLKEKLPQLSEMVEAKNNMSNIPKFTFEYLGRGIDRQNGQIKSTNLLGRTDFKIILKRCPKFERDLCHITESEETEKKFENFFERWGTHFVSEQEVGGAIYIFCTVNSTISKETQESLDIQFKSIFSTGSVKASTKFGPSIENLRKLGVSNEQIIIKGGTLENFVLDFANLTPDILQQWHDSVAEKPVSLIREIRCFPDYQLLENDQNKRDMLEHYTAAHILKADNQMLEPLTQQAIANEMTNEAMTESNKMAEEGCFPPGTYAYVQEDKESIYVQKSIWRRIIQKAENSYDTPLYISSQSTKKEIKLHVALILQWT